MNQEHVFSVGPDVYETLSFPPEAQIKPNRYHFSHAAWQLARMGAFNLSDAMPLQIRMEPSGDIGELYSDKEQYVTLLDTTETDILTSPALTAALMRFAVRKLTSNTPEKLRMLLITSSRQAESNPSELSEWDDIGELKTRLIERLTSLSREGINLPTDFNPETFTDGLLHSVSVRYQRKRNGRLGDESLWGVELDVLKVLQDTGVATSDLGSALRTLVAAVGGDAEDGSSSRSFSRRTAYLLIRDYRRRARVDMPGVRLLDPTRITARWSEEMDIPRLPDWYRVVQPGNRPYIERDCFEQAFKWARRAAMTCGRGLLPVFFFIGEPGAGKSILLKQVAWELYRRGYAVAEITNLRDAASSAERLATAAVAVDSPLILVWDDPDGPGINPAPFIRELAEAQVSGAPMVILAAAPEGSYDPKPLKRISRTAFEEFTVHAATQPEWNKLSDLSDIQPENIPENAPILTARIQTFTGKSLEDFAAQTWERIKNKAENETSTAEKLLILATSGIPIAQKLVHTVFSQKSIENLMKHVSDIPFFQVVSGKQTLDPSTALMDFAHPVFMRIVARHIPDLEAKTADVFQIVAEEAVKNEAWQGWLVRMLKVTGENNLFPDLQPRLLEVVRKSLAAEDLPFSTDVLKELFDLFGGSEGELREQIIAALERNARSGGVNAFAALPPLLRNNLGDISTEDVLAALEAAKPSLDRSAFKFLLKYLANHLSNDQREAVVESARTAAARDPDDGYAVAAYLKLVWSRGTEAQVERAIRETETWLEATPEDRVVRRAFLEYVLKQDNAELKHRMVEPMETWLDQHPDEGVLRKSFLELVDELGDRQLLDRALDKTADWIEKWGNNRAVRNMYFRRVEKRGDETMMRRACQVAVNWMENHPDDRETQRSLIFLANRAGDANTIDRALELAYRWMKQHPVEPELLRHYMHLADRKGSMERVKEAVDIAEKYVSEHPEDRTVRELLLGMAAKKLDRKIQLRIYDANAGWLANQAEPQPMMEYLVGRLGVRAGIARRAIPLLERAAAREDSPLQNHARLWLGSAYRVAEAYKEARSVWEKVMEDDNPDMRSRAERNIAGLESFLQKKFPDGYPPPPPPRPQRPKRIQRDGTISEGQETLHRRKHREDTVSRRDRSERQRVSAGAGFKPSGKTRTGKPHQDRRKGGPGPADGKQEPTTSRRAATLGDLLKLQGLDLKAHFSGQNKAKKKKKNK